MRNKGVRSQESGASRKAGIMEDWNTGILENAKKQRQHHESRNDGIMRNKGVRSQEPGVRRKAGISSFAKASEDKMECWKTNKDKSIITKARKRENTKERIQSENRRQEAGVRRTAGMLESWNWNQCLKCLKCAECLKLEKQKHERVKEMPKALNCS
jgi:hypothetical protein